MLAYNPDGSNACVQPNTWAVQFNKTFPSNQENIDLKKTELYGTEAVSVACPPPDFRASGCANTQLGAPRYGTTVWDTRQLHART